MSECPDCREREVEMPRVGLCRRCYLRRWTADRPGYMAEAKRRRRADPVKAEADRLGALKWKANHRDQTRAYDRARADKRATGHCACGCRIYNGGERCGRCKAARRRLARREHIAEMWNDGETIRQIATALDSTPSSVGVEMASMRKDGWDLPLRQQSTARAPVSPVELRTGG